VNLHHGAIAKFVTIMCSLFTTLRSNTLEYEMGEHVAGNTILAGKVTGRAHLIDTGLGVRNKISVSKAELFDSGQGPVARCYMIMKPLCPYEAGKFLTTSVINFSSKMTSYYFMFFMFCWPCISV